jgi:hypothetical protein
MKVYKKKANRIIICGDKLWKHKEVVQAVIEHYKPTLIIEGGCRGADRMAREIGIEKEIEVHEYEADWKQYGNAAGPIRNKQMIVEGRPHLVIAFHDKIKESKGTYGMIKLAKRYFVPVVLFNHNCEYEEK